MTHTLDALLLRIARLRADYARELYFAPSSTRPVLNYSYDPHERMPIPDTLDVSEIGATISSRMQRVLSRSYGSDMGVQRALARLEPYCHRRHVKPREPLHDDRGFICARIARFVITHGYGEQGIEEAWLPHLRDAWYRRLIRKAAVDEDLEYEECAEFLSAALIQVERWMDEWTAGAA